MDDPNSYVEAIHEAAVALSEEQNCDVFFVNSEIDDDAHAELAKELRSIDRKRPNALLVLVTHGGDPDAGYRMARCLQRSYEKITALVAGPCKSAGTLITLGATELAFTGEGELGPLDIQMSKKDHLLELQSGLAVDDALIALQSKAYQAFENFFLETEVRSRGVITVKTASDIATKMATGLFAPLYAQLDPMHVGEVARAMQVAQHYGNRLNKKGRNLKQNALRKLIGSYPSHGCVIDKDEAETLFQNVRNASEAEARLAGSLDAIGWLEPGMSSNVLTLSDSLPVATEVVQNADLQAADVLHDEINHANNNEDGQLTGPISAAGESDPAAGS